MRDLVRLWKHAVLAALATSCIPFFANAAAMSDDQPRTQAAAEGDMQGIDRIRREIHLGMTDAEAKQIAQSAGAKVFSVGFISGPPGTSSEKDLAPRNYILSISLPGQASDGSAGSGITLQIHNGVVIEIRDASGAGR